MFKFRSVLLSLLTPVLVAGCASPGSTGETSRGLVGAWIVTASRPAGVGKNLLTFSSDGTFFRSGDTHPVLSGAHGAWKRVGDREFDATYIAFRFDQNGKWIGSTKTRYILFLALETTSSRAWLKPAHATRRTKRLGRPKYVLKENVSRLSRSDTAVYTVTLGKVRRSVAF